MHLNQLCPLLNDQRLSSGREKYAGRKDRPRGSNCPGSANDDVVCPEQSRNVCLRTTCVVPTANRNTRSGSSLYVAGPGGISCPKFGFNLGCADAQSVHWHALHGPPNCGHHAEMPVSTKKFCSSVLFSGEGQVEVITFFRTYRKRGGGRRARWQRRGAGTSGCGGEDGSGC